jgi:ribonucleoside-diphosphate reductase alpha chain
VLNDKVYKYDNDRGITVETTVQDYATKYLKDRGIWEYTKNIIPNVHDLTIHDHLETMKIFAKYTDNSISKTINIGNNVKFKDFKDVYMQAYNSKYIKGCTTYRTGTMASVISMTDKDSKEQKNIEFYDFWKSHKDEIVKKQVKVPSESDSKRYIFKIPEGRKWYFHVSFKDKTQKRPFEIFATTNSRVKNVNTLTVVDDLHKLALELGVPRKHVDQNNIKLEKENNVNKIMRTISLMLRHNVSLNAIIEVLDSIDVVVTSFIFRFRKFLRTFIDGEIDSKNKCVICGGTLRRLEGCSVCMDCGDSKCG